MEDIERDTLAFDRVHDDDPDACALPGTEGWGSAVDDGATRRTVTLEGRASRVGWYVAGGGLLGALSLTLIVITLPWSSSQPGTPSLQSHQRVAIQPAQRSPRRPHHHARPGRKPKGQRRLRVVRPQRVIHHRDVVPVAPPSPPAPPVVAVSPPAPPAASAPVQEQEQPRALQRRRGGQFSYLGG